MAIIKTDQCFFINKSQRSPLEIWKECLQLANEEGKRRKETNCWYTLGHSCTGSYASFLCIHIGSLIHPSQWSVIGVIDRESTRAICFWLSQRRSNRPSQPLPLEPFAPTSYLAEKILKVCTSLFILYKSPNFKPHESAHLFSEISLMSSMSNL